MDPRVDTLPPTDSFCHTARENHALVAEVWGRAFAKRLVEQPDGPTLRAVPLASGAWTYLSVSDEQ